MFANCIFLEFNLYTVKLITVTTSNSLNLQDTLHLLYLISVSYLRRNDNGIIIIIIILIYRRQNLTTEPIDCAELKSTFHLYIHCNNGKWSFPKELHVISH